MDLRHSQYGLFGTIGGMSETLQSLAPGMAVPFGGTKVTHVSPELAGAFAAGDRLVIVQDTGALLHIPASEGLDRRSRCLCSGRCVLAAWVTVSDAAITAFYEAFAQRLESDDSFAPDCRGQ